MAYTTYTTDEIEAAIDGGEPDHACGDENWTYDQECAGCAWEDEEHGWHEFGYGGAGDIKEVTLQGQKVNAVYLDGESGGEGSGESVWIVFRVGTQYFKKTGYYASYDGTHWDGDVVEVRPRQVTSTIYEKK